MSLEAFALIATTLTGIITVIISLRTSLTAANKEAVESMQVVVNNLEKALKREQDERANDRRIMLSLQNENKSLRDGQENLREELKQVLDENHDLRAWAEELVGQVKGAGLVPVPFRPRPRKE